jgi:hypothetical protein
VHDAIACYKLIYDEKKRATAQSSLDMYYFKRPSTSAEPENILND